MYDFVGDPLEEDEIIALTREFAPHFPGHSRKVILFALVRAMAGLLVMTPADAETRADMVADMWKALTDHMAEMDLVRRKAS
jgi:hypothetical protein